ncbi:PREDICTED: uncharacterized protein LOC107101829 [Cyprinodon variegatus]|uniref:Si:dkeyp-38g8.5 n=1 Tax=Cyprinodon variegatus TaxID=28743 RepID=A0A3Q2CVR8_CYPVA|nr:PREDICTED: uncharacterized protein LOC107101829 [Cyprinodon variegatus]
METTIQPDHEYTNNTFDQITPKEFTYKMSKTEVENFVKLRASNGCLFSRQRNSSKWAWRTILKHMGLHHKMTHRQASKKWENLKKRYKDLKNPPPGVRTVPETWHLFSLMDDALKGRLQGSAPVLKSLPRNNNNNDFLLAPSPKRTRLSMSEVSSAVEFEEGGAEIEVLLNGDEDESAVAAMEESEEMNGLVQEVDIYTNSEPEEIKSEQQLLACDRVAQKQKTEQKVRTDWDAAIRQQDRMLLERERAAMERERGVMERERAVLERERALIDREKLMLERERDALRSERLVLEKQKARWERLFAQKERTEGGAEDGCKEKNSEAAERKERLLCLLEKLVEDI